MKAYTQKDMEHVMDKLDLLSETEKEALYKAVAHGTAYPDLESKYAFTYDSICAAVLTHTPKDAESPMHAAFIYLYDCTRRRLGFFASEIIIRSYYSICERRPEDYQELAIAARLVGEMRLYSDEPTSAALQEAQDKLIQSFSLFNGMRLNTSKRKGGRAKTMSSLAALKIIQNQDSEAELLLKEAKTVFRDLSYRWEEWRPYYAGSLVNLADFYERTGKEKTAVQFYKRSIDVLEKCKQYDPYYIEFAIDHVTEKLMYFDEVVQ